MERMEMVEKLRKYAGIGMEEARDVLERNSWDILDAMVELERDGKLSGGAEASTKSETPEYEEVSATVSGKEEEKARKAQKKKTIEEKWKKLVHFVVDNRLVVTGKNGEQLAQMPILVPIICALLWVWATLIVLVVGVFFGVKYSFEGEQLGKKSVNDGVTKACEYTQNIVDNIVGRESEAQSEEEKK